MNVSTDVCIQIEFLVFNIWFWFWTNAHFKLNFTAIVMTITASDCNDNALTTQQWWQWQKHEAFVNSVKLKMFIWKVSFWPSVHVSLYLSYNFTPINYGSKKQKSYSLKTNYKHTAAIKVFDRKSSFMTFICQVSVHWNDPHAIVRRTIDRYRSSRFPPSQAAVRLLWCLAHQADGCYNR